MTHRQPLSMTSSSSSTTTSSPFSSAPSSYSPSSYSALAASARFSRNDNFADSSSSSSSSSSCGTPAASHKKSKSVSSDSSSFVALDHLLSSVATLNDDDLAELSSAVQSRLHIALAAAALSDAINDALDACKVAPWSPIGKLLHAASVVDASSIDGTSGWLLLSWPAIGRTLLVQLYTDVWEQHGMHHTHVDMIVRRADYAGFDSDAVRQGSMYHHAADVKHVLLTASRFEGSCESESGYDDDALAAWIQAAGVAESKDNDMPTHAHTFARAVFGIFNHGNTAHIINECIEHTNA